MSREGNLRAKMTGPQLFMFDHIRTELATWLESSPGQVSEWGKGRKCYCSDRDNSAYDLRARADKLEDMPTTQHRKSANLPYVTLSPTQGG